jgi:hypothetical protein
VQTAVGLHNSVPFLASYAFIVLIFQREQMQKVGIALAPREMDQCNSARAGHRRPHGRRESERGLHFTLLIVELRRVPSGCPVPVHGAEAWLELDEQERIALVETYHRVARSKLPNVTAHAALEPGCLLRDVTLQLGDFGALRLDLEIVAPRHSTNAGGERRFVTGFKIVALPGPAKRMLQRVITQLETRRQALVPRE